MINFSKLSLGSVQWGRSYGLSNIQGQTKSNEVSLLPKLVQKHTCYRYSIKLWKCRRNSENII